MQPGRETIGRHPDRGGLLYSAMMRMIVIRYWGQTEPPWERANVPWIFRARRALGRHDAGDAASRRRWSPASTIDGWRALLPAAAIFMVSRAILRPLLIVLTCPLELLTLGLFTIIVNALVFAFTAWFCGKVDVGFSVDGFWAALLGSLVVSGVYFLVSLVLRRGPRRRWRLRRSMMRDRDRYV